MNFLFKILFTFEEKRDFGRKMRFLRRVERVTLFNKVRSSETRKSLNIDSLLLLIEDFNFDGLAMKAECLGKDYLKKLYLPKQMGKDQLDDLDLD